MFTLKTSLGTVPCGPGILFSLPPDAKEFCLHRPPILGFHTYLQNFLLFFTDHRMPSEERPSRLYRAIHTLDQPADIGSAVDTGDNHWVFDLL